MYMRVWGSMARRFGDWPMVGGTEGILRGWRTKDGSEKRCAGKMSVKWKQKQVYIGTCAQGYAGVSIVTKGLNGQARRLKTELPDRAWVLERLVS